MLPRQQPASIVNQKSRVSDQIGLGPVDQSPPKHRSIGPLTAQHRWHSAQY